MCYLALADNSLSLGGKPHNHSGDMAAAEAKEVLNSLKRKAADQPLSVTQNLVSEVLAGQSLAVNQRLPALESMAKTAQRAKAKAC